MPATVTQIPTRRREAPPAQPPVRRGSPLRSQWSWLAAGLVFGFLVPFVLADRLELGRDLYYGLYVAAVVAFLAAWLRVTGLSWRRHATRGWRAGLILGAAAGAVLVALVLRADDATARPDGLELAAAVVWRGLLYGAADGLLLSVFPILAVVAAFAASPLRRRLAGRLAIGALALVAALGMTATYHLGYGEFRSSKLAKPLAGASVWSAPTLLTLSPLGAPVAHASMHVAAVLHSYETETFLPPHAAPADAAEQSGAR